MSLSLMMELLLVVCVDATVSACGPWLRTLEVWLAGEIHREDVEGLASEARTREQWMSAGAELLRRFSYLQCIVFAKIILMKMIPKETGTEKFRLVDFGLYVDYIDVEEATCGWLCSAECCSKFRDL